MNIESVIDAASAAEGVPAPLLRAVGITESGLNPSTGASRLAPAAGGQRGQGMMQLTPSTAASVGVDPNDPSAAIYGAARYLRQGYDATGSWDDATRFYHGGPDRRQWGPRTEAYRTKVSTALADAMPAGGAAPVDPAGDDGGVPTIESDHDNAFTRGLRGMDASAPPPPGPEADPSAGDNFFSRGLAAATGGAHGGAPIPVGLAQGKPDLTQGADGSGVRGHPILGYGGVRRGGGVEGLRSPSTLIDVAHGSQDALAGAIDGGLVTPAASIANGIGWLAGKAGATDYAQGVYNASARLHDQARGLAHDPTSVGYRSGDIAGEIAATLPLGELATASRIPMLARAGAAREAVAASGEAAPIVLRAGAAAGRLGDMAVQGGVAGAELSSGSDEPVSRQIATGALFAPTAGAAFEKILPEVAAGMEKTKALAAALRERFPGASGPVSDEAAAQAAGLRATAGIPAGAPTGTASVERTSDGGSIFLDAKGNSLGGVKPDGSPKLVVDIHADAPKQTIARGNAPAATPAETLRATTDQAAQTTPEQAPATAPAAPSPSDPAALAAGLRKIGAPLPDVAPDVAALAKGVRDTIQVNPADLGSRGLRRGIEANTDFPPDVQQQAQALVAGGVPMDQAIREAEIRAVGAKPTLGSVTRTPADIRAVVEGAKQSTPEGQRLAQLIADNNQALHHATQQLIGAYGGAGVEGQAAMEAAHALAGENDAMTRSVANRYAEAEAAEGPAYVPSDDLYAFVTNPYHAGAINSKAKGMVAGLRGRLDLFTNRATNGLNAHSLEHLRKFAIDAYDDVGSPEVRNLINGWTRLIDEHMARLGDAGPTYAKARAAHEAYAKLYRDPEGVAKLIKRTDNGTFLHEDRWAQAEHNLIVNPNDRPFIQVARQLQNMTSGDGRPALNRLKAAVVQHAYEAATGKNAGTATDMMGNSNFSGAKFMAALNRIGMPKIEALFLPQEIGRLGVIGRAATHLNEAPVGVVNHSGTTSTLADLIRGLGTAEQKGVVHKIAQGAGHVVGGIMHPVVGNLLVEGVSRAAMGAKSAAAAARVEKEISRIGDPEVARSTARVEAKRLAAALRRRGAAQQGARRAAPVIGGERRETGS